MARKIPIQQYRNIGISAHVDAGKTTTTERMLFFSGVTTRIGEVEDGTALMDWMEQERERGISISAATTTCFWSVAGSGGPVHRINIIDTPGHVDFSAEVERCMRVLDGVCVVFDGIAGVQPQSEAVWHQADKYLVPRLAFVNKMDREGADFFGVVGQIRERLSIRPVPVQIPVVVDGDFSGFIDLIGMRAMFWDAASDGTLMTEGKIPDGLAARAFSLRDEMIEAAVDADDSLMAKYVAGETLSVGQIKSGLRAATIRRNIVPVLCGAARKNKGIQAVLDAVVDFLPSPVDVPPVRGVDVDGGDVRRRADDAEPFSALAFKSMYDFIDGQLTFFRVYSGVLNSGDSVYVPMLNKVERVDRLFQVHADQRNDVSQVFTGDIAAAVGLEGVRSGDTLCSQTDVIILDRLAFPDPVMHVAVEPKTSQDAAMIDAALRALSHDDPSLRIRSDTESGQTIVSGMGELHLEVVVDRLRREFGLELNVGAPQVAFREVLLTSVTGDVSLEGPDGVLFGRLLFCIDNSVGGVGVEFLDESDSPHMDQELVAAFQDGVGSVLSCGVIQGFPIVGVRVRLLTGSFATGNVDAQRVRQQTEVSVRNALKGAQIAVFEPMMSVVAETPDDSVGNVVGELKLRKGQIVNLTDGAGRKLVKAVVPLSGMFGFATTLRSLTRGRASYSMEFEQYAVMPVTAATAVFNLTI